jgi:hypothetical protein
MRQAVRLRVGVEVPVEVSDTEREVRPLIPIESAAKVLKLSHWGVRYRVKRGLLNAVRRKRRLFFEVAELLRAVEATKKKAK